jgi:hypothetical protein
MAVDYTRHFRSAIGDLLGPVWTQAAELKVALTVPIRLVLPLALGVLRWLDPEMGRLGRVISIFW